MPEPSDGIAMRSGEALPAERLEQAHCSKYLLLRCLLPTCSLGGWFLYADKDFQVSGWS